MCCLLLPVVDFKKKRGPTWAERWIRWNCLLCYPSLVSIIYTERKKKAHSEAKNTPKNRFPSLFTFRKNFHDSSLLYSLRGHFGGNIRGYWPLLLCLYLSLTEERDGGFEEGWTARSVHTEISRYHRELRPEWDSNREWRDGLKCWGFF